MYMPYLFWLVGLLLIFLEFFLPGAVLGVGGGILLVVAIGLFISQVTSGWAILFFIFGVLGSVALLIRFALWRIQHAKPEYSIYLGKDQEGYVASHYDETAIGKKGIVVSDLKPGGFIKVEGKQHQAISQSGYLTAGSEVLIIGGEGESLIVKPVKKEN